MNPLPMLRNQRDWQSLAYLVAQPSLMYWQWRHGWQPLLFGLSLLLAIGISIIHHNHAHLPLWRGRRANRATDLWITLLQGHPTCVFHPAHNRNHHRHRHGPSDCSRTWRFGDHNHLLGWLLHPLLAVVAVYPLVWQWLRSLRRRAPRVWRWYLLQYLAWLGSWCLLLAMDPGKALLLVIVPQLFGLHWLLGANYLQHAHADDRGHLAYARNFEGASNLIWFNIGLHTAHHEHARAHWSHLPALHARYRAAIPARLLEPGLSGYITRVFLLAPWVPRLRSHSLRGHRPDRNLSSPYMDRKDC
ncbi:fatty acid desaturase [Pseudoxanthomonas dokdonensis]|uniref:Fatty acid desaturase n=1 Tax=Pseudoxanthomonas dokdonensis TaxID=344882 RepID=A0A0R0CRP3_9GAMM|nr:fatty acid desaturase [Pseudoxanthomonas dokdonensis]KRG69106.1 fatty acid desaturase [Pseudoxanthomonas dokdonensis]